MAGQQVFDAMEPAAFFAHVDDGWGGRGHDAGHLLKLRGDGGVPIERRCRRRFLLREGHTTRRPWRRVRRPRFGALLDGLFDGSFALEPGLTVFRRSRRRQ